MKNRIYEANVLECKEGHYSLFCECMIGFGNHFIQYDFVYIDECKNCGNEVCPQCDYGDYCSQKCLDDEAVNWEENYGKKYS